MENIDSMMTGSNVSQADTVDKACAHKTVEETELDNAILLSNNVGVNEELLSDTLSGNTILLKSELPVPIIPVVKKLKRSPLLDKLLLNERKIRESASKEILYSPALITRDGFPVIRRGTINIIQGAQGSHKSRLAAMFCSLLLMKSGHEADTLGFKKVDNEKLTVCYIDTERNIGEEFPEAIQSITKLAGYSDSEQITDFRFTSIKNIDKLNRLNSIKDYIHSVRVATTNPLFVILDVVTDCIFNFNDPVESMKLFDTLGILCEDFGATFLLTIHENPGSEKARGHVGTEGINKSSYAIHIGFEKIKNGENTDMLWMKEVKNRHAGKHLPTAIVFSEETKSLKVADGAFVKSIIDQKREKADIEELKEKLPEYLKPTMSQKELLDRLVRDFKCSEGTIKTRLDEIIDSRTDLLNELLIPVKLKKRSSNGKPTFYELVEEAVS